MDISFKLCDHGELYKDCPLCKTNKPKETRIEFLLRNKKYIKQVTDEPTTTE